jgi:hypothetical protein
MKRHQVAIDLETLGKKADSILLAIGAVAICELTGERHRFYCGTRVSSQPERTKVQSTIDWWGKQSPAAREAFDFAFTDDCPTLTEALGGLADWVKALRATGEVFVWGNGANFDLAMLEHAFQGLADFVPWDFRNTRDMRTLYDLTKRLGLQVRVDRVGTHHHALDDADYQAQLVLASLRLLPKPSEA